MLFTFFVGLSIVNAVRVLIEYKKVEVVRNRILVANGMDPSDIKIVKSETGVNKMEGFTNLGATYFGINTDPKNQKEGKVQ